MARRIDYQRLKGEDVSAGNGRTSRLYKEEGLARKVFEGRWLSKADYEAATGRPGASLRGFAAVIAKALGIDPEGD